jgi:hypothetical protein
MKKYIIINYYIDTNSERKREYLFCIQKNLNLDFISGVVIFLENSADKKDLVNLRNFNKIILVLTKKRLDFKTAIFYADKYLKKSIVIILNLDIFLANSSAWRNIDNFFITGYKKKAVICHRHNLFNKKLTKHLQVQEIISQRQGDFSDAWILQTPFDKNFLKSNFSFSIGNSPGCDGLIMGILTKFYHVYNFSKKCKIYHFDVCRKINKNLKFNKFANSSFIVNSSIDLRPLLRVHEWVKIPPNQDWNLLLSNKIQPLFFKSHINKNFIYNFKGIFLYFKYTIKKLF